MNQAELYKLFQTKAAKNGWNIDESAFPDQISGAFWPKPEKIFKAFELVRPNEIKYVIVGLDPYPGFREDMPNEPIATGLAFAIPNAYASQPPSLRNILNHLFRERKPSQELIDWVQEKDILLLNAALTVPTTTDAIKPKNVSGKHLKLWSRFLKSALESATKANPEVKVIAWGVDARSALDDAFRQFEWCHHPSRLSDKENSFKEFCRGETGHALALD